MRACKNVAFDICYWTENLAKTWLISVVVYVRTFYHIIRPFAKVIPVSQRVSSPEALSKFKFLRLYQILIPSKTSVNPGANPGSTFKVGSSVDDSFCIFARPLVMA
jgi:hypothetical protein